MASSRREFQKILLASFISLTGSHFLTLSLAAFIMKSTGSAIQASLVFIVTFLPSVFFSGRVGHWIDRSLSRKLLIYSALGSAALTVLCGLCIASELSMFILAVLLSLRSVLNLVAKTSSTKWIKEISPPALQKERFKVHSFTFFLATALSGLMASIVLVNGTIQTVVIVDVLTFLLAIGVYLLLNPFNVALSEAQEQRRVSYTNTIREIFASRTLRTLFLLVALSQAVFQGAYQVLVTYLPVQHFNEGMSGVGFFQMSASGGIIAGFLLVWLYPESLAEKKLHFPKKSVSLAVLAAGALLATVFSSKLLFSLPFFFVLNFGFEAIWLHSFSEFFRASPKISTARYNFTLSSTSAFLMSLFTLVYATLIQFISLVGATTTMLVFLCLLPLFSVLLRVPERQQMLREGVE